MDQAIRKTLIPLVVACVMLLLSIALAGCSTGSNQPSSVDSVDGHTPVSQTDASRPVAMSEASTSFADEGVSVDNISFSLDKNNYCTIKARVINNSPSAISNIRITSIECTGQVQDNYGDPTEKTFDFISEGAAVVLNDAISESIAKECLYGMSGVKPYIFDLAANETRDIEIVAALWDWDFITNQDDQRPYLDGQAETNVARGIDAINSIEIEESTFGIAGPGDFSLEVGADLSIVTIGDEKWEKAEVYYIPLNETGAPVYSFTPGGTDGRWPWESARFEYIKPGESKPSSSGDTPDGMAQAAVLYAEYEADYS